MKNIALIITLSFVLLLSSCGVTRKFTVYGKPDTEIYTPNMKKVTTIQNNGVGKVTLNKKEYGSVYVAYLLAREPNSSLYVPFALDYKNAKVVYSDWLKYGVGIPAAIGVVGGVLIPADEVAGAVTMSMGLATTFISGVTWLAMDLSAGPTERFRYLKRQNTIQDIVFVQPKFETSPKLFKANEEKRQTVSEDLSSSAIDENKTKKSFGDKSSRKIGSLTKQIEGDYTASGSLSSKSSVVEEYSSVTIRIHAHNKNEVLVEVLDDYNDHFFDQGIIYQVTKDRNGGYVLKHEKNNGSVINIDKNGRIGFVHPRVNIDGDFYSLKVTGHRIKIK